MAAPFRGGNAERVFHHVVSREDAMMFEKTGMRNVVALSLLPYGAGPALSVDRCKVIDPIGAPLNIRDAHKNIVGAIRNGGIVRAPRDGSGDNGKT
jgi:hypothetical protein